MHRVVLRIYEELRLSMAAVARWDKSSITQIVSDTGVCPAPLYRWLKDWDLLGEWSSVQPWTKLLFFAGRCNATFFWGRIRALYTQRPFAIHDDHLRFAHWLVIYDELLHEQRRIPSQTGSVSCEMRASLTSPSDVSWPSGREQTSLLIIKHLRPGSQPQPAISQGWLMLLCRSTSGSLEYAMHGLFQETSRATSAVYR